jgi:diguanylate cyclase (GGDEF)-like protein
VGIQHDITAEVESKLKLENINLSLEKIVKERTIALEKANQELNHLAKKDPLTGAFNRRAYYEQMDIEIKRCSRLEKACSIALIDVDFFKIINDQYGHSAGDTVLVSLVRLMTSKKRELDYLFRLGGEEFLLLMPCTNNKEALIVTERIRRSVEDMEVEYEKIKMSVTVSIGLITEAQPKFDEDYLKKVDHYLYQAKANGRNQIAEAGSSPV